MTGRRWYRDPEPTISTRPPGRYVLVYDDGWGFCSASARWIGRRARRPLNLVGLSAYDVNENYLGSLSAGELGESAHLVTPRGAEYHGGEAITRALRLWRWGWLVRPLDWPGLSLFRAMGYRLVARNRGRIPGWLLPR